MFMDYLRKAEVKSLAWLPQCTELLGLRRRSPGFSSAPPQMPPPFPAASQDNLQHIEAQQHLPSIQTVPNAGLGSCTIYR